MSEKELNAYIDESGDEGFKEGSSQWFIISSVVVDRDNDQNVATAINDIKYRLWQTQTPQPLHWVKLDHKRKRVAINEIAKRDFVLFSVALEKKYLDRKRFDSHYERESRAEFRWAMYFYAAKLLIERVCKYAERQGAKINLIFENRGSISYSALRDYLTLMAVYPGPYMKPTIKRETIKSLEAKNKQTRKLLQVADICSGALYDALQINKYGDIEESYLMSLADKFDRVNGRLWGYGMKLFPRSARQIQEEYDCYSWMAKI
ncbi:MAG: DUF3800 domain-containing protein [Dehalococcoidia bacterium]|nr:DUF3800 domain-containing protein [Dehalococcoidia bacterium]